MTENKNRSWLQRSRIGADIVALPLALAVLAGHWRDATFKDLAGDYMGNAPNVALATTPEDALLDAPVLKEAIIPSTYAYFADATGPQGRMKDYQSPEPWKFLSDKMQDFTILDSFTSDRVLGSLHAVAFRQESTGKIFLTCAGCEIKRPGQKMADWGVAFRSTGGGFDENELSDLIGFADRVEKKHGKIDVVCGHSIGGFMGCALKPHLKENVQLIMLDGPGVTYALRDNLAKYYGKTPEAIEAILRDNTKSVIIGHTAYNRIGRLPGHAYTQTPQKDETLRYLVPDMNMSRHSLTAWDKAYTHLAEKLEPDSPDGVSTGSTVYSLLMASVIAGAGLDLTRQLRRKPGAHSTAISL